jgi:hypothetical protein
VNTRNLTLPLIALAIVGCSGGDTMSTSGSSSSSSTPSAGGGVTLRLKPKKGDVYVLENVSEQGGQTTTMTMNTTIVESNDSTVVMESTFSGTGAQAEQMKGMKVIVTSSPRYEIQGVKVDSKDPMVAQFAKGMETGMKMMPVFPEKEVKPGETWKGSFDLGKMMKDMGLPATFKGDTNMDLSFTFKGVEEREGRKVAIVTQKANDKFNMTMMGQEQEMTMALDGETAYDLESGMAVFTKTATTTAAGGQSQVSSQTVKLKEIK